MRGGFLFSCRIEARGHSGTISSGRRSSFPAPRSCSGGGGASMAALVGVWAIAGWTAALVGLAQSRVVPRPDRTLSWLREQRHLAFRFMAEFVVSSGTAQLAIFLIAGLTTLADVGHLKAGQMMLGPLNILFMGAGLVAVAETSRFLAQSPKKMEEAVPLSPPCWHSARSPGRLPPCCCPHPWVKHSWAAIGWALARFSFPWRWGRQVLRCRTGR